MGIKDEEMVDLGLLMRYGARTERKQSNEVIFREGDAAHFFHQVVTGSVKLVTYTENGKEFIQGVFEDGESFGEPPLFCAFPYPSTALAIEPTMLVKIPKDRFLNLLKENFEVHLKLDQALCERLKYKSMVLANIAGSDPEQRIWNLLKYLKKRDGTQGQLTRIPYTRQQLADMSGLRVETVIRTVTKMASDKKIKLKDHKILV